MQEFWPIVEPGVAFVDGWAIRAVCDHLEAVTRGDIKRLLINIPPRMSKSTMVGVFWPAWEWGPKGLGHLHYLVTSFSGPNMNRDTSKMAKLVESPKFQQLWGADEKGRPGVRPTDKWGEKLIRNTAGGQREGRPFSKTTGGGGDRLIVDDPHDTQAAESDVQRTATVQTFREGVSDRLRDPVNSAIVIVMQRLHERDVSGEVLALNLGYVHLNLPMEFEAFTKHKGEIVDARCRTYIDGELFFEDPRQDEGELLFPERFPPKVVEGYKISKGSYGYAGQYQQRPVARDGGMFKRQWFDGKIIPASEVPDTRIRVRAWDRAATKVVPGKDPDFSASLRMSRNGPDFYIENVSRWRETPGVIRKLIKSIAETDPHGTRIILPKDPGQAGVDQSERDVEYLAGYSITLRSPVGAKEVRAEPLSIQAEFGHVYLVEGDWNEMFLDELCTFPAASHDDMVDAASDAFNEIAAVKSGRFEAASEGAAVMVPGGGRDSRQDFTDNGSVDGFSVGSIGNGMFG